MRAVVLEGIRVLDFSHALAGPYCTMLMARYGAHVYKLEPPAGDPGRGWGPPFLGDQAAYFLGVNAGKRGLCIDLKRAEGRDLCLRLMERVDVVIENFRPGAMDRLGLGYASARERNPRIVYCSISGYGQDGPSRDDSAMDLIMQAASGLISVTGTPAGEVARCGHSVADITAGMFALIGILMALNARERSGTGQYIDISMLDSMISAMASNYAYFLGSGVLPKPMGTAFATIVPYRTFAAADREVAVAAASEKLWAAFCEAVGRPDLADHPDYRTNSLRVRNRAVLEPMLAGIFRQATAAEWVERLAAAGVPCSPVRTLQDVVDDPQSAHREMFPEIEGFRITGLPVKFPEQPVGIQRRAPRLGEHTREVLGEVLQLTPESLDRLASDQVIH